MGHFRTYNFSQHFIHFVHFFVTSLSADNAVRDAYIVQNVLWSKKYA